MSHKDTPYHHGDLQAALVTVAAEMIAEGGLEAVTMRSLSDRIGVSRAAPYRHFRDKSALLAAVAQEGFEELLSRLGAVRSEVEGDLLAQLQQMGVAYIQFALDKPTHYRLMFSQSFGDRQAYPDLSRVAEAVFAALLTTIEAGQGQRLIRDGDPRVLARITWALVHGQASLLIDGQLPGVADPHEQAQRATHALVYGLASAGIVSEQRQERNDRARAGG